MIIAVLLQNDFAALAATLAGQPDFAYPHCSVDCLAHVVNCQGGHGYCRKGLHLDTGLRGGPHLRRYLQARTLLVWLDLHLYAGEWQGVAERDQLVCPFGRKNACNLGRRQHIALAYLTRKDKRERARTHLDVTPCNRLSACIGLSCHVHHSSATARIEVRQSSGELGA